MKLLLDEQISGRVAEMLRKRGVDAFAVAAEASLRGLDDPGVFEIAQEQRRALVTYNRDDFEAIVRERAEIGRPHHGLVIVHPIRFPSQDLVLLSRALSRLAREDSLGESFVVWLQAAGR